MPDSPTPPSTPGDKPETTNPAGDDFASRADQGNAGLLREIVDLILTNKKWWLIPVIVVILLIGLLTLLTSSALAPFIYPLF